MHNTFVSFIFGFVLLGCAVSTGDAQSDAPSLLDVAVEVVSSTDASVETVPDDLLVSDASPSDGAGDDPCVQGTFRCGDGAAVEVCGTDGRTWLVAETCPGDSWCQGGSCTCGPCAVVTPLGCHGVGVGPCPDGWVDDGSCGCEPVLDEAPPGTIPLIGGGSLSVGPSCQGSWAAGADGFCRPSSSCPSGTIPAPDGHCEPLGPTDECGEAPWGVAVDAVSGGGVWYVLATSTSDEPDGSEEAPFHSIAQAVAAASPGDTVIVGSEDTATTYDEGVAIDKPLTLWGRCSDLVVITGHVDGGVGGQSAGVAIKEGATGTVVRGLTIANDGSGLVVGPTSDVVVRDVSIEAPVGNGVYLSGAEGVTLTHVTIDDPQKGYGSNNGWGLFGTGVDGLALDHVFVHQAKGKGVLLMGCSFEGSYLAVEDMAVDALTETNGQAVYLDDCPAGTLSHFAVRDGIKSGVYVEGGTITLDHGTVTTVSPDGSTNITGYGVAVTEGGTVTATWVAVEEASSAGIYVTQGSTLSLTDGLVARTVMDDTAGKGRGVVVDSGSEVTLTNVLLEGNAYASLYGWGSTITAERLAVLDTLSHPGFGFGKGIWAEAGSTLTMDACLVSGSVHAGVHVTGSTLVMHGSRVTGTSQGATNDGTWGNGVWGQSASMLSIGDSLIDGNSGTELLASGETIITIDGCVVGALDQSRAGFGGRGVETSHAPLASITATRIAGNQEVGLFSVASSLQVTATTIIDTLPNSDGNAGFGVQVTDGGVFSLEGSVVSSSRLFGAYVRADEASIVGSIVAATEATEAPKDKLVIGLVFVTTPKATVDSCLVADNMQYGLFSFMSGLSVTDTTIVGTRPHTTGTNGNGLYVWLGSADVEACRVIDNHVHGVAFLNAVGTLTGCYVATSKPGVGAWLGAGADATLIEGLGDGVAIMEHGGVDAAVEIAGSTIVASSRAGIIFDGAAGTLVGNTFVANQYAYHTQGTSSVVASDNLLLGNSYDQASGQLAVDNGPKLIPGF